MTLLFQYYASLTYMGVYLQWPLFRHIVESDIGLLLLGEGIVLTALEPFPYYQKH